MRFTESPEGAAGGVGRQRPDAHVRPVSLPEPDDLDLSEEHLDRNGGWGLHLVEAPPAERAEPTRLSAVIM